MSNVENPAHYGGASNPYEAIKIIESWSLGFHLGNALKYILRAPHKGAEREDLQKARWYLERATGMHPDRLFAKIDDELAAGLDPEDVALAWKLPAMLAACVSSIDLGQSQEALASLDAHLASMPKED